MTDQVSSALSGDESAEVQPQGAKKRGVPNVTQACDGCKSRKRRCDGGVPCNNCANSKRGLPQLFHPQSMARTCTYTAIDKRRKTGDDNDSQPDLSVTGEDHLVTARPSSTLPVIAGSLPGHSLSESSGSLRDAASHRSTSAERTSGSPIARMRSVPQSTLHQHVTNLGNVSSMSSDASFLPTSPFNFINEPLRVSSSYANAGPSNASLFPSQFGAMESTSEVSGNSREIAENQQDDQADEASIAQIAKTIAGVRHMHEEQTRRAATQSRGRTPIDGGQATPTHFLDRLHSHLNKMFTLPSFPRGDDPTNTRPGSQDMTGGLHLLYIPTQTSVDEYTDCYFQHASATYRYVQRATIRRYVQTLLQRPRTLSVNTILQAESALALLVLAIGCLWTPSWNGADPEERTDEALQLSRAAETLLSNQRYSKPRLIRVQTLLATAQLQLGFTRFQHAWESLGMAARLAQLLRLHRNADDLPQPTVELHRQVFWSAFMMDRYLSLVLGLPVIFNERDITQLYPAVSTLPPGTEDDRRSERMLIGTLAHVKLARILGHAMARLDQPDNHTPDERDAHVQCIENELTEWRRETPEFFHPGTDTASLASPGELFTTVPAVYLRQQRTVRSAYFFVRLYIYRSYLLEGLLALAPSKEAAINPFRHRTNQVHPSQQVMECVKSALGIAEITASMQDGPRITGTFWNTAFFTFSSLTVLMVYLMVYPNPPDRDRIEGIVDRAIKGHQRLAGSPATQVHAGTATIIQETERLAGVLHKPRATFADSLPLDLSVGDQHGQNLPSGFMHGMSSQVDDTFEALGPFTALSRPGSGMGNHGSWDTLWRDMQEWISIGLDVPALPGTQPFLSFDDNASLGSHLGIHNNTYNPTG